MAGVVTGECVLIDRLNYGSPTKVPPVDTIAFKNHLQLDHSYDDDIVLGSYGYLMAATEEAENRGNVSLIKQKRRHIIGEECLSNLSEITVQLGFGPIITLTDVRYLDEDGAEQVMPTTNYRLLSESSSVYFYGTIPTLEDGPGTVWVNYEAGYGDDYTAVPPIWQNVVNQIAFRKYDLRSGDGGNTNGPWERLIDSLIVTAGGSRRG